VIDEAQKLVRVSGLALIVAGALCLPVPLFPDWTTLEDIGSTSWSIVHGAVAAHHALVLYGLTGILAAQLRQAGPIGAVAFVLASLGNLLAFAFEALQLSVLPVLASDPDAAANLICTPFYSPATRAAAGLIATACGSWSFDLLATGVVAERLLLTLATALLGLVIAVAGVLTRWAGVLILMGALFTGVGFVLALPERLASVGLAAIGAGYLVCGLSLAGHRARHA
jgi:hypothetical protein